MRRTTLALAALGLPVACLDRPAVPSSPETTNIVVEMLRQDRVSKIDLLFSIDNSISMADKQRILADAVPQLVRRLVQPICVDEAGAPAGGSFPCGSPGTRPEFPPVLDIHVGVVTSSLGGHGGDVCGEAAPLNDRARLLPAVRPIAPGDPPLPEDGNGFLWWRPESKSFGEAEVLAFEQRFAKHVTAAGENGCGFEASLESWYRFLIDPAPPSRVELVEGRTVATRGACGEPGSDDVVCAQRAQFLRPDSLVAIVVLSDENDCSIRDADLGWYVSSLARPLARATAACADPNDRCCRSCAIDERTPPEGCAPLADDPECKKGELDAASSDRPNHRCWDQKRRFGLDFLYPTGRYVNALSKQKLCLDRDDLDPDNCGDGRLADNPLFPPPAPGVAARRAGPSGSPLVFFAGIVGVPWQDIATEKTLPAGTADLEYLSWSEIGRAKRWGWITGDSANPPADPLMVESRDPRVGTHPLEAAFDPKPPTAAASANPVNGHDWRPDDNPELGGPGDLQYACTFELEQTKSCDASASGCDCKGADRADYTQNNPLCQNGDGSYGIEQRAAKAYPGLRQLAVMRDYQNSIVASICPKVLDETKPAYGYNPAVGAIIKSLKRELQGKCLPRTIALAADGSVPCKVLEASPPGGACDCAPAAGRCSLDDASCVANGGKLRAAVHAELAKESLCSGSSCNDWCVCLVPSYDGEDKQACENVSDFEPTGGWCYVDPAQGIGEPALVAGCSANERHLLRFEPAPGAVAFIACLGGVVAGG
jgi:hypothetical protein